MNKKIEALKEFHTAFGLGYEKEPTAQRPKEIYKLRHRLMQEENEEYLEAAKNQDLIGIADALGDMLYVLLGTVIEHGMQDKIDAIFEEIHASNMSKLGEDGKPIYRGDGKILKGKHYFRPNLKKFF